MSISGIGNTGGVGSIQSLQAYRIGDSQDVGASSAGTVSSDLSDPARQLQELEQLSQSDPAAFETKTAEIAKKLKELAGAASGDQARFLGDLSGKFEEASKTGDISSLKPSGPPPGGFDPSALPGDSTGGKVKRYAQQQDAGSTRDDLMAKLNDLIQSVLDKNTEARRSEQTSSAT